MQEPIWPLCLTRLENDLPIQQFNTWIRPLQAIEKEAGLTLLAPNRYVRDTVERDYLGHIAGLANNFRHRDIAILLAPHRSICPAKHRRVVFARRRCSWRMERRRSVGSDRDNAGWDGRSLHRADPWRL